jgi:hypothetical protein
MTETNINMAIRACKEERSELLKTRNQMQMIKESLNDSYCDVSGQKDLVLAGEYCFGVCANSDDLTCTP